MSIQYVNVRVDTSGLYQPVTMAQGVVGIIGPAVPSSFETRNPESFNRPLVGVRGEPYERIIQVMGISVANEPLDADGNPLGGPANALVDSLGFDNAGNPVAVPGLKIDSNGAFVGDDGTTRVEVDRSTNRPMRFDRTLYELEFDWFPTAFQVAGQGNPPLFGALVDQRGRVIADIRLDSEGTLTSLDGGTVFPVNPATGYPERPGTGGGAPEPITNLNYQVCQLAQSINLALINGATRVWAFRTNRDGSAPTMADAFADFMNKQINIVCLSHTTDATSITALRDHVEQASPNDAGGGGTRPRIGVAMLPPDGWTVTVNNVTSPSQALTDFGIDWTSNRMALIAHLSDDDVAAAAAGLIARYDPWISLTMKPLTGIGQGESFTDAEISTWMDPEAQGIIQARINPIVDPEFLAGAGLVMGESYTMDGTGQRQYVDIVRVIDDLAFRLKAHLTNPNVIGTMRINRSGLTGLRTVVAALLDSRVAVGEIDSYEIEIPLLNILQKDAAQRTPEETQQINTVQNSRRLAFNVSADYAGAIHFLNVTLRLV